MFSSADVHDERKHLCRPSSRLRRPCDELVVGERAGLEELLHQLLVGLRHHFDQRFARGLDGGGHVARDSAFGELAASVGLQDERLLRDEIDDALERALFADRQLNRHRPCGCTLRAATPASARGWRARDRAGSRRRAAAATSSSAAAQTFSVCTITPATRVDDDDRRVGDVQRGARVAQEVADAGRVDQIDLLLVPLGVREAGRERVLARDFFFVVIGDGRALVDLAEAVDHAGVGEDGGGELGLAGTAVTDESDVSDGLAAS